MPKTRAPYPAEFREEMIRLVRAGRSPGSLSREFEPSEQTIGNWVNQADVDNGHREEFTTAQLDELRRLRRENRILREEKEILAKAAAWFAEQKPVRHPGGVWVRESQPGHIFGAVHVRPPGCLPQRLLRVAQPPARRPGAGGPAAPGPDCGYPQPVPEHIWGAPHPRRVSGRGCGRGPQTGGPSHAPGPHFQGVHRRRKVSTTRQNPQQAAAPDLVRRNFTAHGPNRIWVADITYVPTKAGFLYVAVVIDVWSRRVVGWSMRNDLTTPLVTDAPDMAISQRKPTGVIHHSDRGSQPRFKGSSQRLESEELQWEQGRFVGLIVRCGRRCGRLVVRRSGGVSIGSGFG